MAQTNSNQTLEIGMRVFYPAHGVAAVVGVEEQEFGGRSQLFFSLELDNGHKVLLPVDNVERAGVRELVPATRARNMLERVVKKPSGTEPSARRQRVAAYKESLKTGSADSYTEVLQSLLFRSRTKNLAMDEKRVFEEARGYFVSEICAVLDMPRDEVLSKLAPE